MNKIFSKVLLASFSLFIILFAVLSTVSSTQPAYASSDPVGAWSQTTSLPYTDAGHTAFYNNNKIYVLGGGVSYITHNDVITNNPNPNGSLGSNWGSTSPMLYNPISHSMVRKGNNIYILGGLENNVGPVDKANLGTIQTDGSMTWQTLPNLPGNRVGGGAAVVGDWIYYMGGADGGAVHDEIYYSHINSDGTINSWSSSSLVLPAILQGFSYVAYGDSIYIIGGQVGYGTTIYNKVFRTHVNQADGSLSDWEELASRPEPLAGSNQATLVGSKIITYGGGPYGGPLSKKVYYSDINPDGTITPWQASANDNPEATAGGYMLYANGYLYIIAGNLIDGYIDRVYYAPVQGGAPGNVAPVVSSVTAGNAVTQLGQAVNMTGNFSDANTADTHTVTWNWGDSSSSAGSVTESNGSGTVSGSHTYTQAGVYEVTLTVTDNSSAQGSSVYQYEVIYDPASGFITGNGKYNNNSPAGQVKFGFNVKYTNNNAVPSGDTKINFQAGGISLDATSYLWLVVSGSKSVLKGNATVNGNPGYTFLVSGIDGSQTNTQDLIRVQIKDSGNNVIYDTQPGASDTADPTTPVAAGHIKVH